jgi:hypothetical protein
MNMNPDLNLEDLAQLQARARRWLDEGWCWPDVLEELEDEGVQEADLHLLLYSMGAWRQDAQFLKQSGWPYAAIVSYLRQIRATWADVAIALQSAGLTPADVLREVAPLPENAVSRGEVIQVAICHGPEDANYAEARGVIEYWGGKVQNLLRDCSMPEPLKRLAAARLGFDFPIPED